MKLKNSKLLVFCFIFILMISSSITVFATNSKKDKETVKHKVDKKDKKDQKDENDEEVDAVNYQTFSGKVTKVDNSLTNFTHVHVENKDGMIAQLVVSQDTQILGGQKITLGAWVTGFYDGNAPIIMIYPPQYVVDILIVDVEEGAEYGPFTGIVQTITESTVVKGSSTVYVEGEDGLSANIVISKDTLIVQNKDIKVGAKITAFYNKNAPMIMIYPPQYSAKVVVVNRDKAVDEEVVEPEARLESFTGKVKKLRYPSAKIKHVYVENSEGTTAVFVITSDTYIHDNKKIKVGSNITGYYNANMPMIMIYPPQYSMDMIIVKPTKHVNYQSVTGTVMKITNSKTVKGQKTIYIENESGAANIVITKDTKLAKKDKIKVGSVITTYYDGDASNITIYPLNYTAKIVRVIKDTKVNKK